jgi:hypothetical protein
MYYKMFSLALFLLLHPLIGRAEEIYQIDFSKNAAKGAPAAWKDRDGGAEDSNWRTTDQSALAYIGKAPSGLLILEGPLAEGKEEAQLKDGTITATFQKSADDPVSFGLAGRVQDGRNFLAVRFSGDSRMSLVRTKDGVEKTLASWITRKRYPEGGTWELSLSFTGPQVTARVRDQDGVEQLRLDALDESGTLSGKVAVEATAQAGVKDFKVSFTPLRPGKQ